MTTHDEHDFPYYRSPKAIRSETFTHRMRGLDEAEVREYLDLLAAQVEALERERSEMLAELQRLRARNQHLTQHPQVDQSPPPPQNGPQGARAAAVLSQAQEVANQLIQDANRRAQQIVAAAQRQGHEAVQRARVRTEDRMQSMYEELDAEFRRLSAEIRSPGSNGQSPSRPRYDI